MWHCVRRSTLTAAFLTSENLPREPQILPDYLNRTIGTAFERHTSVGDNHRHWIPRKLHRGRNIGTSSHSTQGVSKNKKAWLSAATASHRNASSYDKCEIKHLLLLRNVSSTADTWSLWAIYVFPRAGNPTIAITILSPWVPCCTNNQSFFVRVHAAGIKFSIGLHLRRQEEGSRVALDCNQNWKKNRGPTVFALLWFLSERMNR